MGALEGEPVRMVREQISEFGGNLLAILIGWVIAAGIAPARKLTHARILLKADEGP